MYQALSPTPKVNKGRTQVRRELAQEMVAVLAHRCLKKPWSEAGQVDK
jgi:hypothetical protein